MKKIVVNPKAPTLLDNKTCPYCGIAISEANKSKEHVIGRRFVPKGSFHGAWNLILNSCHSCNNKKAELEDDISIITLSGKNWFNKSHDDQRVNNEIARKIDRSKSNRTGKVISKSGEQQQIVATLGPNIKFEATLVSPPQIDENRVFQLASCHLRGFFYFLSYSSKTQQGGFWEGEFAPVNSAAHTDWGNSAQASFMDTIEKWQTVWHCITADGFFKSIIRKQPKSSTVWAWALEWNQNYRVIGFFGNLNEIKDVIPQLNFPKMSLISKDTQYRQDMRLNADEDTLFTSNLN